MTREEWAVIVALATAVGTITKAWWDRRAVRAKADLDETSATVAVTAAARELVDPLRQELQKVRLEHKQEVADERKQIESLRAELRACQAEAEALRGELAMARVEADDLRRDREEYREKDRLNTARIRDLERRLAEG